MARTKRKDTTIPKAAKAEAAAIAELKAEELRREVMDRKDSEPETMGAFLRLARIQMELELAQAQAQDDASEARQRSKLAAEWAKVALQLGKAQGKDRYAEILETQRKRAEKGSRLKALTGGKKK